MTSPVHIIIRDVEDLADILILGEYLHMYQKCPEDICEFTFLQDFPQNAEGNYRRQIIKYMLDKYIKSACIYNERPDLLVTFTFIFRYDILINDVLVRQISFGNNMLFRYDILMICFLQHLIYLNIPMYLGCKVTMTMISIMVDKYNINIFSLNFEINEITFVNVSLSFTSVYFDMLYNNFLNFSNITRAFPCFNLPPMIYAPLIITIFPILDDPPIAILIAISLIFHEICDPPGSSNITLVALLKRITDFYKTTAIPEKMKLRLCTKYNIVVLEGDEFKFAPCFAKYRQTADKIGLFFIPALSKLMHIINICLFHFNLLHRVHQFR